MIKYFGGIIILKRVRTHLVAQKQFVQSNITNVIYIIHLFAHCLNGFSYCYLSANYTQPPLSASFKTKMSNLKNTVGIII